MSEIDSVTNLLIGLTAIGCAARILILFIKMQISEPEEINESKGRIKNAAVFLAIALSVFSLKSILVGYFG